MIIFKKSYAFIGALVMIFVVIITAQAQDHPIPPEPRSRSEVESVLAKAPDISGGASSRSSHYPACQ